MAAATKKDALLPRERVLEALALREPDRVPWVEIDVDQVIVDHILGLGKSDVTVPVGYHKRDVEQEKAFSRRVGKDNIMFPVRPPLRPLPLPALPSRPSRRVPQRWQP